jgi:hypothetical protein
MIFNVLQKKCPWRFQVQYKFFCSAISHGAGRSDVDCICEENHCAVILSHRMTFNLFTYALLILSLLVFLSTRVFASSVELTGEVKIDSLKFPDGTSQTTANLVGATGATGAVGPAGHSPSLGWSGDQISIDSFIFGPHLTGPQGPQGESAPVGPERILYINRLTSSDFVPVWLRQCTKGQPCSLWQSFSPVFNLTFNKLSDTSILRLSWSDNVGIFDNCWCNIGLFIDDQATTNCAGSWSGVTGAIIFNQQNISCVVSGLAAGSHTVQVKHRSQYCVFGNYAFDNAGLNRFISVEEQN